LRILVFYKAGLTSQSVFYISMQMTKTLTPLLLLFIIVFGSSSCRSIKDPQFQRIENIRLGKLGLNESTLNLDILYSNLNNTSLKLKSAEGEAWLDNTFLGHFTVDTLIKIPANDLFRLPVKLQVDMRKILQSSLLAFLNPEVVIKVNGKARVGKGFVYINYPIKYEGKQNLRELIK